MYRTFAGPQARHTLNLNADAVQAEQFHENVLQKIKEKGN